MSCQESLEIIETIMVIILRRSLSCIVVSILQQFTGVLSIVIYASYLEYSVTSETTTLYTYVHRLQLAHYNLQTRHIISHLYRLFSLGKRNIKLRLHFSYHLKIDLFKMNKFLSCFRDFKVKTFSWKWNSCVPTAHTQITSDLHPYPCVTSFCKLLVAMLYLIIGANIDCKILFDL